MAPPEREKERKRAREREREREREAEVEEGIACRCGTPAMVERSILSAAICITSHALSAHICTTISTHMHHYQHTYTAV